MDENYLFKIHLSLRKIIQAMEIHSRKLLKLYGLSGPQIYLLRIIRESGELKISDIAKKASLSQATVTDIMTRLEKSGYIIRTKGSLDKRNKYITLTPKSESMLEANPSLFEKDFIEKLSKLEEWERSMMLSALQRISMIVRDGNGEI